MDYKRLLEMQEKLDQHIMKQHKLPFIKLEDLVLAANTELSEVANDYQVWKHWKVNPKPKPTPTLLEEVADFTHFLAILSNRFKITGDEIEKIGAVKYTIASTHFNNMHLSVSFIDSLPGVNNKRKYVLETWKLFKGLLEHLGFTEEQIFEAYLEKHKKNYQRQATGY